MFSKKKNPSSGKDNNVVSTRKTYQQHSRKHTKDIEALKSSLLLKSFRQSAQQSTNQQLIYNIDTLVACTDTQIQNITRISRSIPKKIPSSPHNNNISGNTISSVSMNRPTEHNPILKQIQSKSSETKKYHNLCPNHYHTMKRTSTQS